MAKLQFLKQRENSGRKKQFYASIPEDLVDQFTAAKKVAEDNNFDVDAATVVEHALRMAITEVCKHFNKTIEEILIEGKTTEESPQRGAPVLVTDNQKSDTSFVAEAQRASL